jgi:hypothetical protein
MVRSASSVSVSAVMVIGSAVIHSETACPAASKCFPRARTMSRSVKIPARRSPSITNADPIRRSPMTVAASATVVVGSMVNSDLVMISPTVPTFGA